MLCKYVLIINGVTHELSKSCIRNWDEIQCTLKRNDFEGVTRTFTSKFEFTREAYDLLLDEWVDKYLLSDASIEIYEINNQHTYDLLISVKLDFGTFDNDGCIISMSSVDGSTAKIIKANKSTQYEYLVRGIKDRTQLYYDRLPFNYYANYICGGTLLEDGRQYLEFVRDITGKFIFQSFPLELLEKEVPASDSPVKINSVTLDSSQPAIIIAHRAVKLFVIPKFDFYLGKGDVMLTLSKVSVSGTITNIASWLNSDYSGINHTTEKNTYKPEQYREEYVIDLVEGESVKFIIHDPVGNMNVSGPGIVYFDEFSLNVKWTSTASPIYIDVSRPIVLLDRLLKSMNGDKEGLIGEIDSEIGTSLSLCAIVAAESIRGIPDAKLYTSYTKFVEWMEAVFGYVPIINGNKVKFVHRDKLFTTAVTKGLGSNHTEFTYSVNEKMIYSSVCVGYEKQDYDSINGRDEFRFTTEFTTGINITDNKLELISPYRADAYGFEFLAQKRGQNTTDNESDNDIFFVGAESKFHYKYVNGFQILVLEDWKLIRGGNWSISGVLSPDTMFNVMYNQRAMLLANEKYIGISADKLNFASTDGNSDVVINSVKLSDPFVIQNRLATCAKISFSTFEEKLPSSMDGIVTLEKDGFLYQGYMSEISYKVEKPDGIKYELIVKSISRL